MIKQNTCSKGDEGLCIDLLITNSKFLFLETNSFETGLSDQMIYTILNTKLKSLNQRNRCTAISNNMIVTNLSQINRSTLRNLVLIKILSHFGKHVNRIS